MAVDLYHHAGYPAQVRLSGELLTPDYTYDFTAEARRRRGFLVVCRSDFSRENEQFATKVAPMNTCNLSLRLRASAVNKSC
jgi:hypothetical protein